MNLTSFLLIVSVAGMEILSKHIDKNVLMKKLRLQLLQLSLIQAAANPRLNGFSETLWRADALPFLSLLHVTCSWYVTFERFGML